MKAAVMKDARKMVVEDVPDPVAGPDEVVVKVNYVGICGSDLHLYKHGLVPPDHIMGHEVTGTIMSLGSDVSGWKQGDRVWLSGGAPCGKCERCLREEYDFCPNRTSIGMGRLPGGYAEYIKVPPRFMIPIPEDVSLKHAALLDPLGCAYHAAFLSNIQPGQSALVMGAGPIGLFLLQCLKLEGAKPLILTEPVAARAELGRRLGADLVLDPTKEDVEEHCGRLTRDMGPEMVFECVGIPQTVLDSVSLVRKKGKVMWVGFCPDEVTFTPALWFFKKISIQTSFGVDSRDEVHHCMKLIQDKKVAVEELISEIISIDEVPRAFERLLKPNTEVKILVGF